MSSLDISSHFTQDHQSSVLFARQILKALNEKPLQLAKLITQTQQYYVTELEPHFQHEEQTVFAPLYKKYRQQLDVATLLLKEHGHMRMLAKTLGQSNAQSSLKVFAELLISHTQLEDTTLLPSIQTLFSQEELQAVRDFTPIEV